MEYIAVKNTINRIAALGIYLKRTLYIKALIKVKIKFAHITKINKTNNVFIGCSGILE
jgi:hypothetical protein